MKTIFYICTFFTCLIIAFSACTKTNEKTCDNIRVLDPIREIPEWLKVVADKALPGDSLNVWIPAGDLSTSSMIRVPRFPSVRRETDTAASPFDIHPVDLSGIHVISGVRNEQQSFQVAVASKKDITGLWADITNLVSERGDTLSAECIKVRYVRYVPVQRARSELIWTPRPEEVYGREVSGYGAPDVVGDPLMKLTSVDVPAYRAQPIWFTLQIPADLTPGTYHGLLNIHTEQYEDIPLHFAVNVYEPVLPSPEDYSFFLDLWFNPNAVAAFNDVEPWSEAHWQKMEPYLEDLASRGAKTIAATIVPNTWTVEWLGGSRRPQTYTGYPEMVTWLRDGSGNWSFDYTIFDRYIETCFRHGIDRRIDAFSLTPFEHKGDWKIYYRHKEDNTAGTLSFKHPEDGYKQIWKTFLKDFETHLDQKGWLDKTYLSFDESPREVMDMILSTVSESAPNFLKRFSIAGKIETEPLAASHSLFYSFLPEKLSENDDISRVLDNRRNDPQKTSTFYLCGEPAHPNTFAFSPAMEARMIPWLAAYYRLDGYLRWAYNNWTDKNPYHNPVFNFIQGDDYYVYPGKDGPVSSIRWELLKEGIEDFELLRITGSSRKEEAVELAVRNRDGRKKDITDFDEARNILLGN